MGCSIPGKKSDKGGKGKEQMMNLPNRLTCLRIALIPVCLLLWALGLAWASAIVFALACVTDFLDGYIARKQNIVTTFGKFADPVADKILVLCAMIMLSWHGLLPAWIVVAVMFRELAVDGLRLVAVEQGRVIAAGKLGKIKTTVQITLIIVHLVYFAHFPLLHYLAAWLMIPTQIAMLVMTVWSGVDYFLNNKEVLHG